MRHTTAHTHRRLLENNGPPAGMSALDAPLSNVLNKPGDESIRTGIGNVILQAPVPPPHEERAVTQLQGGMRRSTCE